MEELLHANRLRISRDLQVYHIPGANTRYLCDRSKRRKAMNLRLFPLKIKQSYLYNGKTHTLGILLHQIREGILEAFAKEASELPLA